MKRAKLQAFVDNLKPDERLFLQAYLDHLRRADDPSNAQDLSRRMKEMDAGRVVTLLEAKRLCGL